MSTVPVPERAPVALEHNLSAKQVAALVELYLGHEPTFHHATRTALMNRGLVNGRDDGTPYLTDEGREVAGELLGATPDEPENNEAVSADNLSFAEWSDDNLPLVLSSRLNQATGYLAQYRVVHSGGGAENPPTTLGLVVGSEVDAQEIADSWNLGHLPEIAAQAGAQYAVVEWISGGLSVAVFNEEAG